MNGPVEQDGGGAACAAGKNALARPESSPAQTEGGCGSDGHTFAPQPRFLWLTRADLRNAPSGMDLMVAEWRRKAHLRAEAGE